ncbi:MAG: hypothetical protein IJV13_03355 [Prevotella sp.]|nr:hypothetical protein [Prevotella sp.]
MGRETAVCFKAAGVAWEDYRINKIQMPIATYKNITVNSIKNVVLTIYEVLPIGQICKTLFPQELQSPQGLFARPRMQLPIGNTRLLFGIHLLVVLVQYYLHPSRTFGYSRCKFK